MSARIGSAIWSITPPQLARPLTFCAMRGTTQELVGGDPGFGTADGAPKRHPAEEHVSMLPVSVEVVGPSVSRSSMLSQAVTLRTTCPSGNGNGGTVAPPPPK